MTPTRQLRLLLLAWLFGLVLSLWIDIHIASVALILSAVLWSSSRHFLCCVALVLAVSIGYGNWYNSQFYPANLTALVGQTIQLKAVVQGESRVRGKKQTVRLKVQAWKQKQQAWQPLEGQLIWSHAPLPILHPGDDLEVEGVITNLSNWSEDFDARAYWSRWGVSEQLNRGTINFRPPIRQSARSEWRSVAQNRLNSQIDRPHLTVALGMLVGLKEKLPRSLDEAFKKAGLQHLLVVSGTNITLLIVFLSVFLKALGPWWRYGIGVVVIGFYLYLVGFEPPALRASLFGVLAGLALTSGHFAEYRNLLLLVAVGLSVADPRFVTHDVSFHLSFGATLGMVLGVPWLYQKLSFIFWPKFRLLVCASVAAQFAVFPILIIQFGSFPYMGLFTNLITEPLVPLIMFLAAGGVLLGDLSFFGFQTVWSAALWGSLEGLIKLAQVAAQAPSLNLPVWSGYAWAIVLLFGGLWACFSSYYQTYYWEKLETEMA